MTARRSLGSLLLLVAAVVLVWALLSRPPPSVPPVDSAQADSDRRSAAADDPLQPILPDPARTPGDVLDVTVSDICVSGYAHKVRNVPQAVKEQVYRSYGVRRRAPKQYEIDHLINLSIGGSNSARNLWPESFLTEPWNAHVKDALEVRLHDLVCHGRLDLATAQHEIATDWIAAYRKYYRTERPLAGH